MEAVRFLRGSIYLYLCTRPIHMQMIAEDVRPSAAEKL